MVPRRILAHGLWNTRVYRSIYKRQLRLDHAREKPVKNQQHAEARPDGLSLRETAFQTLGGRARSPLLRVGAAPRPASLVPPRGMRSLALAVHYFSQCIMGYAEGHESG